MNNFIKFWGMKKLGKLNNKGFGTIEVILILVVLIGLVIIFREQLLELINRIFDAITKDSGTILS